MNNFLEYQAELPRLTAVLAKAEEHSAAGQFLGGDRSRGLEELLDYLHKKEGLLRQTPQQQAIELLIARARKDFEVATICIASGLYSLVFDVMRDVMEIELLLRDFSYIDGNAERWLRSDDKTRRKQFAPAELRSRYAKAQNTLVHDLSDSTDYAAHSKSLHVSPSEFLIPRGLFEHADPVAREFCFQDLFGHARNLVMQIENCLPKEVRDQAETEPFSDNFLPRLSRAFSSTQLLGSVFLQMLTDRTVDTSSPDANGFRPDTLLANDQDLP